jgi:hypothetical protein
MLKNERAFGAFVDGGGDEDLASPKSPALQLYKR